MGLDRDGILFLLSARAANVRFDRTIMLGRQSMHVNPQTLKALVELFGYPPLSVSELEQICPAAVGYAESFLAFLGATDTASLDATAFEHATFIHDLNTPVPDAWKQKFTTVLDGGTLEHVFNFPQAVTNAMEMVALDGHFLSIAPANNLFGHGFYQFSPEIFFRVLSPKNGFRVERIFLVEHSGKHDWYQLRDPAALKARVTLTNMRMTYLLVQARREEVVPLFQSVPQQSDYAAAWIAPLHDRPAGPRALGPRARLRQHIPQLARDVARVCVQRFTPMLAPSHARKVPLEEIVHPPS
jgi:hypothetical protein